jgi:hypothetical protein
MKKQFKMRSILWIFIYLALFSTEKSDAQCSVTSSNGWTATFNIIPTAVIPEFTNCPWYYHYEIRYTMSVTFTGSTTNRSISCNVYFNCTGGTGNQPYNSGGTYTSNSSTTLTTNNNARQYTAVSMYNYGTNPNCNQVSLADVNCKTVRIDYWGSGVTNGTIICNIPVPLPITLLGFSGEKTGKAIQLKWSTATEINNSYFTIERSSDGKEFAELGKVKGAGNSNYIRNYNFSDENPFEGINYYRVKQTDFDGQFSYTPVIAIRNRFENEKLKILPNPVLNAGLAKVNTKTGGIHNLLIVNQLGSILLKKQIELLGGEQIIDFDANGLIPGIYTMVLTDETGNIQKAEFIKR